MEFHLFPSSVMILVWNVRGAGDKSFPRIIKNIIQLNQVLAILEPRISGTRALQVINSLGFTNHHIVDATGFSGGIWLLWNCFSINISIVDHSSQSITALITHGNSSWLFTVVYAHPCAGIRKPLWNYLDGVSTASNLPWLVAGDFNEIIYETEKKSGRPSHSNSGFGNWIGSSHLVDLGFFGADFTWCKKNEHGKVIWERLDGGLCSITWRHKFPEAFIRHLPRVKSDHCPLIISLDSVQCLRPEFKLFRFQAMWMLHNGFKDFLSEIWNKSTGNVVNKTTSLTVSLTRWNKEIFGNLYQQKKRFMARLDSIQRSLCKKNVPFLFDLEKKLLGELNVILDQEELFWIQKSRNSWLKEGDKNTKFFHLSTIVRRRRNKIEGLKDRNGVWHTDKSDMHAIVILHFNDIFSLKPRVGEMDQLPHLFPQMDLEDQDMLNREVSNEDRLVFPLLES